MGDVVRLFEEAIRAQSEAGNPDAVLSGGGGGGTFDGMERVVKLETLMDVVRTDVGALKADVRDVRDRIIRLEERVSHLPSKGFIVTVTTGILTLVTAVTLFQSKLQAFLNIAQ